MEQKHLGIIVSSILYRGIMRGKRYQILTFYEEAGKVNNVIPCFFRLEDIQPGVNQIKAYVMNKKGEYEKTSIPRPLVIHNRGYHYAKAAKKKIRSLQGEGINFYNEWNRYGKFRIHEILMNNKEIKPHMPETLISNKENLLVMMNRHSELIIKPDSGTLGKRTMKAARVNESDWILHYSEKKSWFKENFSVHHWSDKIEKYTTNSKLLIQERIPLAKYRDNPFDIRVSVQRNGKGEWQVTGMVCKVAKSGSFVTNVARGGTCFTLNEIIGNLPHLDYHQVYSDIERLSIKVAKQLGEHISNLADIGLDVGITNDGFPMFIECNARDLRYSFRNANLLDAWKATYTTPISYGKYLLNLRNKQYRG